MKGSRVKRKGKRDLIINYYIKKLSGVCVRGVSRSRLPRKGGGDRDKWTKGQNAGSAEEGWWVRQVSE